MDLSEIFDADVLYNPAYWLLTGGAIIALILGFSAQGLWSTEMSMPLYAKILTIVLTPVASYLIVQRFSS